MFSPFTQFFQKLCKTIKNFQKAYLKLSTLLPNLPNFLEIADFIDGNKKCIGTSSKKYL